MRKKNKTLYCTHGIGFYMLDENNKLIKSEVIDIEIDLTGFCNAKCPLCSWNYVENEHLAKPNIRSPHEIIDSLKEFSNLRFVRLVGTVSEPTLYPHFFELCEYFVKREIVIEICTNGDTHNEDWWRTLGTILTERDLVFFSICGSTQELHEIYRVGTKLQNILRNAAALREAGKKNDYIQHILFKYNEEDLTSEAMKEIMAQFSHINLTKTYYTRDKSSYRNQYNIDKLEPAQGKEYKNIMSAAELKFQNKDKLHHIVHCKSIHDKCLHMNQFGEIFPCYLYLQESGRLEWDEDYTEILNYEIHSCRLCEKTIKELSKRKGCEIF